MGREAYVLKSCRRASSRIEKKFGVRRLIERNLDLGDLFKEGEEGKKKEMGVEGSYILGDQKICGANFRANNPIHLKSFLEPMGTLESGIVTSAQ